MNESTANAAGGDPAARAAHEEGLAAFAAGDLGAAHAAFERAHRRASREPSYKSWYGLTLVLVERNSNLGVVLVDDALRAAGPDPVLLLNSARAHLALNQRDRAARAVTRGLELWPEDPRLLAAREAMGTRRAPPIPFLPRSNPLNRLLGRLRHRWTTRNGPVYDLSPESLGVPLSGDSDGEVPR